MADFFIGIPNRLELFGPLHLWLSAVFVVLYVLLFVFRDKIAVFGHKRTIRLVMASILLANMAIHYVSKIVLGVWTFDTDLPLHLCFITNFFMIYILYSDNRGGLYRIVYFFTFIGPLPAMIWPDLRCSYDSYIFYQFIISHHVMLLFSLYCLCVLKYDTSVKSTIPTFIIGNIVVGSVMMFNMIFKTNYIMMNELPEQLYEIYPFLTLLPPLVWLELVGILAILASCIPMLIFKRLNRKSSTMQQSSVELTTPM